MSHSLFDSYPVRTEHAEPSDALTGNAIKGIYYCYEFIGSLFPRSAPRRSATATEPSRLTGRAPLLIRTAFGYQLCSWRCERPSICVWCRPVIAPVSSNPSRIRGTEERRFIRLFGKETDCQGYLCPLTLGASDVRLATTNYKAIMRMRIPAKPSAIARPRRIHFPCMCFERIAPNCAPIITPTARAAVR
jgi:hypothetical protein